MTNSPRCHVVRAVRAALAAALLLSAAASRAAIAPEGDPVGSRATGHPDLFVASVHLPIAELSGALAASLRASLAALSVNPDLAAFDVRAGRFGSLVAKIPLVPGPGVGNRLTWAALGRLAPATDAAYRAAVGQAFRSWLQANQAVLGVSAAEVSAPNVERVRGEPRRARLRGACLRRSAGARQLREGDAEQRQPRPLRRAQLGNDRRLDDAGAHRGRGARRRYRSSRRTRGLGVEHSGAGDRAARERSGFGSGRRPGLRVPARVVGRTESAGEPRLLGRSRRRPQRRAARVLGSKLLHRPEEGCRRRVPGLQRRPVAERSSGRDRAAGIPDVARLRLPGRDSAHDEQRGPRERDRRVPDER